MSERAGKAGTVAERVQALIESLPPKPGRQSRLGHISVEDFAELVGTTKQRVIEWRKGTAYPDQTNRERLASASDGRFRPDDFRGPSAQDDRDHRAELEAEVAALTTGLAAAKKVSESLRRRLSTVEKGHEELRRQVAALLARDQPAAPANRPSRRKA